MSLALDKCGCMVEMRGKVIRSHDEDERRSVTDKYLQRVKQELRRQLCGRNKTQVINIFALPLIR